jgi:hypothetical protein
MKHGQDYVAVHVRLEKDAASNTNTSAYDTLPGLLRQDGWPNGTAILLIGNKPPTQLIERLQSAGYVVIMKPESLSASFDLETLSLLDMQLATLSTAFYGVETSTLSIQVFARRLYIKHGCPDFQDAIGRMISTEKDKLFIRVKMYAFGRGGEPSKVMVAPSFCSIMKEMATTR